MISVKSRLVAAPSVALMAIAVLAGCGSNNDASSSSSSSSSASSSSSSAESSASSSAAPTESTSESASSEAAAEPVMPEGYKAVVAPNNGISFGVPGDWTELNSEALADDAAVQGYLEQAAEGSVFSAEQIQQQLAQLDLMASSTTPDSSGFTQNVNVNSEPVAASSVPTEADMAQMVEAAGATPGEYKTVDTPLGQGAQQSYTLDVSGVSVQGAYLIVPSGTGQGFSIITVSTSDATATQDLLTEIAQSLTKA
ncbi:hypothetical protein [Rothia nasisuis]|uniref:hypothetical protein n=1 Tax=Rothia nasisuis TaxID=2109647 RepID=UPI001F24EFEE|nr:hypothetical protein [Rothia nasisuis]